MKISKHLFFSFSVSLCLLAPAFGDSAATTTAATQQRLDGINFVDGASLCNDPAAEIKDNSNSGSNSKHAAGRGPASVGESGPTACKKYSADASTSAGDTK